jgi:hypothetical protein
MLKKVPAYAGTFYFTSTSLPPHETERYFCYEADKNFNVLKYHLDRSLLSDYHDSTSTKMILPAELLLIISSFLDSHDMLAMAYVCRWWNTVLTKLSVLRARLGQNDELLSREDLLRGCNRFYQGIFIRRPGVLSHPVIITNINSIRHVLATDNYGSHIVDIFGRLFYQREYAREDIPDVLIDQRIIAKDVHAITVADCYNFFGKHCKIRYKCQFITLDHQGTLTVHKNKYQVDAMRILVYNTDEIIFLDHAYRCLRFVSQGNHTYLGTIPSSWRDFRLSRLRFETGYKLEYYLTSTNILYIGHDMPIEKVDFLNPSADLVLLEVRKLVWFNIDNYCYITIGGDLMHYRSGKVSRVRARNLCLMSEIDDAVGSERSLYVLKAGIIYYGDVHLARFKLRSIITHIPDKFHRLKVLYTGNEYILHVY